MKILFIQYSRLRGLDTLVKIPSLAFASIAANIDVEDVEIQILEFFSDALTELKESQNIYLEGSKIRDKFIRKITSYEPDIIGLTCKTFEYCDTLELAKIIRSVSPESLIVLGGYHATIAAHSILGSVDARQFDVLVRGEGEIAFNQIVREINEGNEYWDIPGLSFIKDGEIIHNPMGPLVDIDKLKLPNRGLRINKRQFNAFGIPIDIVETSRGCVLTAASVVSGKCTVRVFASLRLKE